MLSAEDLYHRLIFTGGIAFGSRALGVASATSDYDVAITKAQARVATNNSLLEVSSSWSIDEYFDVVPPTKGSKILREYVPKLDILILSTQQDLDTLKEAIAYLNTLDKDTLLYKDDRIKLHEEALLVRGWKIRPGKLHEAKYLSRLIRRIKWTLKNFKD